MDSIVGLIHSLFYWPMFWLNKLASIFSASAPLVGLIIISAVLGVILVYVYSKVSFQSRIKAVKRNISASILESILFRHDIKCCLSAQVKMLKFGAIYFALAIPPLLILIIPCLFVLAQLNTYYGVQAAGSKILVQAELTSADDLYRINLNTEPGLEATPPLRMINPPRILWRVDATEKTDSSQIVLTKEQNSLKAPVIFANTAQPIYAITSNDWLLHLLYTSPLHGQLPDLGIKTLEFKYPAADYSIFGMSMHWIIVFFLVSLISGLIASKFLKIEI